MNTTATEKLLLCSMAFLLTVGVGLAGDNWPHWRGPTFNGVSDETDLPVRWSTTENIRWKLDLPGRSGSTPIVWEDQVFVLVTEGDQIELWSVDRLSGALDWTRPLGGGNRPVRKANMSTPSPVTDGESLWVLTSTGFLRRFDLAGNQIWERDLQGDYGDWGLNWGYGSSPVLFEDSVLVQVLHGMHTDDPSYVLRIDRMTGETLWRVERPTNAIRESPDSYTTPVVVDTASGLELVVTGGDVVTGHDLATGAELWRMDGLNPRNNASYRIVASPLVLDDIIFAPSRERPLLVLRAGGRGDVTDSHLLWSTDSGPDVPTPVTDGTYLYGLRDNGVVFAHDARTGEIVYGPQRVAPGTYSSSPLLADGKIYLTSEDGLTTVIRQGPEFEVLASNDLEGYTLSSPIAVNGQIFIRTDFALWAIGEPTD
jgi:outer membrane protein assembly factor BamB